MSAPPTYRHPSAPLATRPSWDAFVDAGVAPATAAYVLARALELRLEFGDPAPAPVVAHGPLVPIELAVALGAALDSPHRPVRIGPEWVRARHGGFSPFRPQQPVILLVDTLLTGRTAATLLSALQRMDADPLGVAVLVDGRLAGGSPVRTFAAEAPVVSCYQRPLALPHRAAATSPAAPTRGVEDDDTPRGADDHPIPADTFMGWLREAPLPEVLIGHIERGPKRHFTTYLNVPRLVAAHLDELTAVNVELVMNFISEVSDASAPPARVRLFYPEDFAGELARDLASRLSRDGFDVETIAARRVEGAGWALLGPGIAPGFHGVIIDWGAVTAATARGLATQVACLGAVSVHSLVLTSQLDAESEEAVRTTAAIRAQVPEVGAQLPFEEPFASALTREVIVPARFDFLAEARMGFSSASECHLCEIARALRRDTVEGATHLLREHAATKYDLYRPRTRDEALAAVATDLVGSEVSATDAYEVWHLRQRLEACRRSMTARDDVGAEVAGTNALDSPRFWVVLVRLLAAEHYWLKLPPFDGPQMRRRVATEAVAMLAAESGDQAFTHGLRWQATMVLRSAWKPMFLASFSAELIRAMSADLEVAHELCNGMATLIAAPYHHRRQVMTSVLAVLQETEEQVGERIATDKELLPILETMRALYGRAIAIQTRLQVGTDVLMAWHALREQYAIPLRTHSGVITSMIVIHAQLTGPALESRVRANDLPPAEFWLPLAEAWHHCRAFLQGRVFPYLEVLRDDARSRSGFDAGRAELDAIYTLDNVRADRLAGDFLVLAGNPESFDLATQRRLAVEADLWFDEILSGPQDHDSGGARLYQLLEEAPTSVVEAWESAQERSLAAGRRIRAVEGSLDDEYVFFDRALLVDVFGHIIENAAVEKHAAPGRPPEGVRLRVEVESHPDGDVLVTISNDTSQPREEGGRGMAAYQTRAAAFGASLDHGPAGDEPWTWRATLRLKTWRLAR